MGIKFLAGDVIESPKEGCELLFLENMVKTFKKFSIEIVPTMVIEVEKDNSEKLEDTKYTVSIHIVSKTGQELTSVIETYKSDNSKKVISYSDLKILFGYLVNFKRCTGK